MSEDRRTRGQALSGRSRRRSLEPLVETNAEDGSLLPATPTQTPGGCSDTRLSASNPPGHTRPRQQCVSEPISSTGAVTCEALPMACALRQRPEGSRGQGRAQPGHPRSAPVQSVIQQESPGVSPDPQPCHLTSRHWGTLLSRCPLHDMTVAVSPLSSGQRKTSAAPPRDRLSGRDQAHRTGSY